MLSSLIMATVISIGAMITGQVFLVFGISHRDWRFSSVSALWCVVSSACVTACCYAITNVMHIEASYYIIFVALNVGIAFIALLAVRRTGIKKEVM